jgi:transaldolase
MKDPAVPHNSQARGGPLQRGRSWLTKEGSDMAQNERVAELSAAGVSVWLDDLSRDRIRSGNLQSLVDEYDVVGVTTNPTIFAAAISGSDSYDDQIHALAIRKVSVGEALRTITAADVRDACDLLRPVAERTGIDGRVSLEVAPGLAHDTDATAAEAAHLWWLVDRPNLFIKIPATEAGLPAITTSIARGISVNVTLIFSIERYRAVMDAYLSGLEQRLREQGGGLSGVESVASFFVSRVDTEVDKRLDKLGADPSLKGKAAVANAQLAYQAYEEVFTSDRWRKLEAHGARPQRPLWASTGVKNPEYPDTFYVSDLVACGTVNTMPEKTLMAYADHGTLGTPVPKTYDDAAATMRAVADAGIDLDDVFRVLEDEGVQKFVDSWDQLTESVRTELEKKA